jgi:hypothetical protein
LTSFLIFNPYSHYRWLNRCWRLENGIKQYGL